MGPTNGMPGSPWYARVSSLYFSGSSVAGGGGFAGRCAGVPHFAMLDVGFGGVGSGCESGGCVVAGRAALLFGVLLAFGFGGSHAGGFGSRGELYDEEVCLETDGIGCGPDAGTCIDWLCIRGV